MPLDSPYDISGHVTDVDGNNDTVTFECNYSRSNYWIILNQTFSFENDVFTMELEQMNKLSGNDNDSARLCLIRIR